METTTAGSYLLKNQKGSWQNFDYFEAIHTDLGIKVLLFRSKEEVEPLQLDKLKKLRKLGFESVLKVLISTIMRTTSMLPLSFRHKCRSSIIFTL